MGVQLFLDAIDGFDQIFLIAAWKGHARNGMLNGNQRLMYCGGLTPIHGSEFEPVCGKPQAPLCAAEECAARRRVWQPRNKGAPPFWGGAPQPVN
jgi:hypothetical protein